MPEPTTEYRQVVQVLYASRNGVMEVWLAATSPSEAPAAVTLQAGPSWEVKLADLKLSSMQARSLKLMDGDVGRYHDRCVEHRQDR